MIKNKQNSYITNTTFKFTKKKLESFKTIQNIFSKSNFLIYYNPSRRLFVNINKSKKFDITVIIYHVKNEIIKNFICTSVQFILFLSKILSLTERNYWLFKLEITTLIYIICKIRHLITGVIYDIFIIIRTDYSPSVGALR